jgi:hypothetical protein
VSTDLAQCLQCNEIYKISELLQEQDLEANLLPPTGSKIKLNRTEGVYGSFLIPKTGFPGTDAYSLIFATFWIGFIAFWTWGASHGSTLFAMFSIPFWLVGFGMWYGILRGGTETQKLTAQQDRFVIQKKSAVSKKVEEVFYQDIGKVDIENVIPKDPFTATRYMKQFQRMNNGGLGIPQLVISHGTRKISIGENVSEAEMKWLLGILRIILKKVGPTTATV